MQHRIIRQMASCVIAAAAMMLFISGSQTALARSSLSDAQIRQRMIDDSIRGYRGNCTCP